MPDPVDDRPVACFIRHDPEAYPGHIGRRLAERGWRIEELTVATSMDDPNPMVDFGDPDRFDLLVPLGSVWSVYDEATIGNWIGPELELIADAHRRDVPVLGICFGGQALAAALGGVVERAPTPEVGWHRIDSDVAGLATGPWMQWHFDRFAVPDGAVELARSEAGPQAFVAGRSVGVQFHPEVTRDIVTRWLVGAPPEDLAHPAVDPDRIRIDTDRHHEAAAVAADRLVDWFLDEVVAGPGTADSGAGAEPAGRTR